MKINNCTIDDYAGIKFYNKDGVVLSLNLNQYSTALTDDKGNTLKGNLVSLFTDKGMPARCSSKAIFTKDKMFIMRERTEYSFEKSIWLYVPESVVKVEFLGEFVVRQDKNETCYKEVYKLTGSMEKETRVIEILPGDHPIPGGGLQGRDDKGFYEKHKTFIGDETKVFFTHYDKENVSEIYLAPGPYSKIVYTDEKLQRDNLADKMNEVLGRNSHISHYDIEKLLKVFDIKEKENKELLK